MRDIESRINFGISYPKQDLEIYDSERLNELGKRYHQIMSETKRGTTPKNRTVEQIDLVNKVITSMLPVLEGIAYNLVDKGYFSYSNIFSGLGQVSLTHLNIEQTPIIDLIHEGAICCASKFHKYNPDKSQNGRGSVFGFIVFNAGTAMVEYILNSIPNGKKIRRIIRERKNKGLGEEEIFEDLPYKNYTSLTNILYGEEDEGKRNVKLEEQFLVSDDNPEENAILTGNKDRLSKLLLDLNERERKIVEKRNGLNGYKETTLGELSEEYGITRERIRQIQVKAEEKIKKRLGSL